MPGAAVVLVGHQQLKVQQHVGQVATVVEGAQAMAYCLAHGELMAAVGRSPRVKVMQKGVMLKNGIPMAELGRPGRRGLQQARAALPPKPRRDAEDKPGGLQRVHHVGHEVVGEGV
ncbi:unnamed protein product [Phytomonas sp. Hart1]|nr:unnamed protein product [Phytomonas sp. Hart1]|eukprot:CCW69864.1 unnamed protein product [Phytomonas sp. isolate Hart1]